MPLRLILATQDNSDTDEHFINALDNLLLVLMLIVALFITNLLTTKKWQTILPESGASMLFGMLIGLIFKLLSLVQVEHRFSFEPEMFYFILLPPIIFEAGYTMNKKDFFLNMTTILMYAVIGTLISTAVIGLGLYGLASAGAIRSISSISPLMCLQFGSLISATDPVATLSIMGSPELRVDTLMYSLIFGESVLNDAISIVLFRTFGQFEHSTHFGAGDAFAAVGQFFLVSLGSIAIGVIVGLLTAFMVKRLTHFRDLPHLEVTLLFLFAYMSFVLAELAGLSGVMSLFLTGICMKHYAWYTLSDAGKATSYNFFKMIAFLAETFVFVYLGLNLFSFDSDLNWDPVLIVFSMVLVLLARACNIFPLSALVNIRRKHKVGKKMQFMMWFSGLRGAIAFALSLNLKQSKEQSYLVTTTLFIVLATTLLFGCSTAPLLKKLNLRQEVVEEIEVSDSLSGNSSSWNPDDQNEHTSLVAKKKPKHVTWAHRQWRKIDENFMKPMFGGMPRNYNVSTQ